MDLDRERARRWRRVGRPVASLEEAAGFVGDVGFALLFPAAGVELPSLFEAASRRELANLGSEWGPDAERVWGWKDELPLRGLAWYGRFLRGRPSFLSPDLFRDLYPGSGQPEGVLDLPLSCEARTIAEILLTEGSTSTAELRDFLAGDSRQARRRFDGALRELGRNLLVTHFGTEESGSGWPAAVLELSVRVFPVPGRRPRPEARRLSAAARFVETMGSARPLELARAFNWPLREAADAMDAGRAGRQAKHRVRRSP